jgi:SAM-dependent methyltransferase
MESLERYVKEALKWKFQKPDQIPREKWLMRIFSKYALEDIVFFKRKISEIPDEKARDFLTLALIDSSMKSSYAYKDGAFVKVKKRSVPPIKKMFSYKMRRMLRDLREAKLEPIPTRVEIADARMLPLEDESVDFVMTSPPYLNKIEYTNIYKTEYSLFFSMPETKLRSFIGERVEDSGDMPPIAEAYFNDMRKVMQELYRVCKPGAKLAIVIGGGCFPEKVIEVDRILANMSEEIGFKFVDMIVARENWCTRNRTIKVGSMRESIIILEKA